MEASCEPFARAAPPSVLGIGTSVCTSNWRHGQVNLATIEDTYIRPPNAWTSRACLWTKATKVIGLDLVFVEAQDCDSATAKASQIPCSSHSDLCGHVTTALSAAEEACQQKGWQETHCCQAEMWVFISLGP